MKQTSNEIKKFALTKYNFYITLCLTVIMLFLFLIFPLMFDYNNNQQIYSEENWTETVELKQEELRLEIEEIENQDLTTPRDQVNIQSNINEIERLQAYMDIGEIPPAENNMLENSLTTTGLNILPAIGGILIASIIVSKEFTDNTIKTLFLQPIKKTKIIIGKINVTALFSLYYVIILYILSLAFSFLVSSTESTNTLLSFNYNTDSYEEINYVLTLFSLFVGDFIYTLIYSLLSLFIILIFRGSLLAVGIPLIILLVWSSISGFLTQYLDVEMLIPNHWNLNTHLGVLESSIIPDSTYMDSLLMSIFTVILLVTLITLRFAKLKIE